VFEEKINRRKGLKLFMYYYFKPLSVSPGRRRRKLLDDLKEKKRYSHLKEEALDRTMWKARFGIGFGPVVRQTTK
jgi:hypothetical protein